MNQYLEKIFPNNPKLQIKKGDFYYRKWEYGKAIEAYVAVKCKDDSICQTLYHNLWNAYYRLWEKSSSSTEKIEFWRQSLLNYSKSLDQFFVQETQDNYDFVKQKLDEFIHELEQTPQQNQNEEEPSGEDAQDRPSEETQDSEASQSDEPPGEDQDGEWDQIQPKGPSISIDESQLREQWWLSDDEKNQIQEYIENLQQEEKENMKLNRPTQQRDIFDILWNDFWFFSWEGWNNQDW